MKTNVAVPFAEKTHEGAPAARMNQEQALRRSVMACMLWENEFYEDGVEIAKRIETLTTNLPFEKVAAIAIEAREKMKLRHVSLWLTVALLKAKHGGRKMGDLIARVCQRADEPAELLAMYWKDQKDAPLTKQMKVGLARALGKFDEYQLAKNNKDGAVKLRDVLFLSHAKPTEARADLYKRIAEKKLVMPDTWEVALSAGADKKATFERLMAEGNLGALAFIRNLRNMQQAGVDKAIVSAYAMKAKVDRVLPFRFITAARMLPQWEDAIEPMMMRCLEGQPKLGGNTVLLLDVSSSMDHTLSAKAETTRMDAGLGLGVLLREICEQVEIFTFSEKLIHVAPRRGFALRDAMKNSQSHQGTYLAAAIKGLHGEASKGSHEFQSSFYGTMQTYRTEIDIRATPASYDRLIIITDEQTHDGIEAPRGKGYVINVASNKNGVGYGQWLHVDGWSEAVIDYIRVSEQSE